MWTGSLEAISPVWIVESPHNRSAVEALWAKGAKDVTIFKGNGQAEESCASVIADLWLHYGPLSSDPPMSSLVVLGAKVDDDILASLASIGFAVLDEHEGGFSASHSESRSP